MFQFVVLFSQLFEVDVSTKLHHLTRHVHDHLIRLGCIRRGLSEENEMAHKELKCFFNCTNKHIDLISSQLLTSWVEHTRYHNILSDTAKLDRPPSPEIHGHLHKLTVPSPRPISTLFNSAIADALSLVHHLSGLMTHTDIVRRILQLRHDGVLIWRGIKMVELPDHVPNYNRIMYNSLFFCLLKTTST